MSAVNKWIRIIHRWLSFIFLPTVITLLTLTITSGADFKLPVWLNLPVFGTLVLLFLTGAYLFLLHYLSKIRRNLRAKKAAAVIPVLLK
jgi:hypothetical protein